MFESLSDHPGLLREYRMTAPTLVTRDTTSSPVVSFDLDNNISDERRADARTIRALHVVNGEHYAGAERVQDWLAMRLPEFGVEVAFACVKPERFPAARHSKQTPLISLPMKSRLDLRAAWRLARIVRSEHFDLIHTHTPRTALIGQIASRLTGVPLVHHVHGHTASEMGRGLLKRLSAQVEKLSLSQAAAVFAVSQTAARYISYWGIPHEKIHLVPNGVPANNTTLTRRGPGNVWRLGMIALLRPRKGLEVLLQAIALLHKQSVPVHLRVIGRFESRDYEKDVLQLAYDLGIAGLIEWRGFRQDVEAELAELDLAILPSVLPEGMPMAVLEAMAAGVPTIGSRVEGITDVIRSGEDGLLVEPGDPMALAGAIKEFTSGDRSWHEFSWNATERHAQQFSDAAMAAGVANIYRKVLNRCHAKNYLGCILMRYGCSM
jgi:glycosyltransferase involved in cell wall biosynthesis